MPRNTALARLALVFLSRSLQCSPILSTLALTFPSHAFSAAVSPWGRPPLRSAARVTDPNGSAIVGANVVLANTESKTERTATTGGQGRIPVSF